MIVLILILAAACATLLLRDAARESQVRALRFERDDATDSAEHWYEQAIRQAKRAQNAEDAVILLSAELERVEDTHERSLSLVVAELDEKRRERAGVKR